MILSIGWAVGQVMIAITGLVIDSWVFIFVMTVIPLTILLYQAYKNVK